MKYVTINKINGWPQGHSVNGSQTRPGGTILKVQLLMRLMQADHKFKPASGQCLNINSKVMAVSYAQW